MKTKNYNKNCITLIANKHYFFLLCTTLKNINDNFTKFDIVIYEDGSLSDSDKNIIKKISGSARFITYTISDFCHKFSIDDKLKDNKYIKKYTHLNFIKFEIFKLLDLYDTVIYFDTDILITQNCDDLFFLDCDIAWRNSDTLLFKLSTHLESKQITLADIDNCITNSTLAPNGGLLVLNKTFDYKLAYNEALYYFKKLFTINPIYTDEIIFSLIYIKLNLNLLSLNPNIYNTPPLNASFASKIIHFIGSEVKPWNNNFVKIFYRQWTDNYLFVTNKFNLDNNLDLQLNDNPLPSLYYNIIWCKYFLENQDFIIPEHLYLFKNFSSKSITFKFTDDIFYKVEFNFNYNKFIIILILKYDDKLQNSLISNDMLNNEFYLSCQKKSGNLYFYSTYINPSDIVKKFLRFYELTSFLRSI